MRKNSITFKLFIITAVFFIVFLGIALITQTFFSDEFFQNKKIDELEKNFEKFVYQYEDSNWDRKSFQRNVKLFSDENYAQIAILDSEGYMKYMDYFTIEITNPRGEVIIIPLNNFLYFYDFEELGIDIGDEIVVDGINVLENTLLPVKIEGDEIDITINEFEVENNLGLNLEDLDTEIGTVEKISIPPSDDMLVPYSEDVLFSAIDIFMEEFKYENIEESEEVVSYISVDPITDIESIIFMKPVIQNGIVTERIFMISSFEEIAEIKGTMKEYYVYVFLVALIVVIILSFIYSKMVSKPLVEINKIAKKMANLDFSSYCEITTDDEIGSLSSSLNTLSSNLRKSLDELKYANEKLLDDIERERRLEETRKEFVASVSHELKTPLGIIKGFAEGIKDGIYEEKKDYYLDVILDETDKMEGLVFDMLDLSKLQSTSYKLTKEEFMIDRLIHKVIDKFKNHIERKNIRISRFTNTEDILVYADMRRIEQVVVNLMSNGIRHTEPNGNISITIIEEANEVKMSIENSGKHISKEKIDRIWDRFYRVQESRDRLSGGTGLGLAIVKNILELHDSKYGVENTENGVCFYYTLMAVTSHETSTASSS